jgi:DNA-binding LacI/PurR family transcriptional regulator
VLFVLPDWPQGFSLQQYLDEASHVLDEAGYSMVTYTRQSASRARPLWEALDPDVVVGLTPFDAASLAALRSGGVTRIYPNPDQAAGLAEATMATRGTRMQVEHLYQHGHRRLAFANAADPRLTELAAARAAVARRTAHDLGLDDLDIRDIDHRDGTGSTDVGSVVRNWLSDGVTAVAAYNDDVAAIVAGAALRAGLRGPDDLAVIGHDDSPLASMFVPALSSVRMDTVGVGRRMAEEALHLADGRPTSGAAPDIKVEVIARESTGSGPSSDQEPPPGPPSQ